MECRQIGKIISACISPYFRCYCEIKYVKIDVNIYEQIKI